MLFSFARLMSPAAVLHCRIQADYVITMPFHEQRGTVPSDVLDIRGSRMPRLMDYSVD